MVDDLAKLLFELPLHFQSTMLFQYYTIKLMEKLTDYICFILLTFRFIAALQIGH